MNPARASRLQFVFNSYESGTTIAAGAGFWLRFGSARRARGATYVEDTAQPWVMPTVNPAIELGCQTPAQLCRKASVTIAALSAAICLYTKNVNG